MPVKTLVPTTFNVPATLTPVEVMFASSPPPTFNSMLPSAAGIRTLDVPFAIPLESIPVN